MGKECLVVGVQPAITPTPGTSQFEPLDKQAGKFENRPLGPTILLPLSKIKSKGFL
jgi:hypothetical protein